MNNRHLITVFEHQTIRLGDVIGNYKIDNDLLLSFQAFYGEKGLPYYSLGYKCVKFCEYVGVIQLGNIIVEVLPKADSIATKNEWRKALIGMLQTVGVFDVTAPSSSILKITPNSILDLYLQLYINELDELIQKGLIKRYKAVEENSNSLKGSILFSKDLQQNFIHRERFFIRHTKYDVNHTIHEILWKTLVLIKNINTNVNFKNQIATSLLNFPAQKDIKPTEAIFNNIQLGRKTEHYKKALEISRLLLLNYHPDVSRGNNHVLALMFDMNTLWEKFVFCCLKKKLKHPQISFTVKRQTRKKFWRPKNGYDSSIKPDIIIHYTLGEKSHCVVLDTKWKNLNGLNPSPDDLRQLYVYHEFYKANRVALVYPGSFSTKQGKFYNAETTLTEKECAIISIQVSTNIQQWHDSIISQILFWLGFKK